MSSAEVVHSSSSEVLILRELLQSERNAYVSGEELAESLGLSRVAVWKRIEKLRASGYVIEAVQRKGYRVQAVPDSPIGSGILARINSHFPLKSLFTFKACPSTNEEAMRRLAEGAEVPFACITKRQPRGKGRRGRSWSGDSEGNVYATVADHPMISPSTLNLLPIRIGLNLCRSLTANTGLSIRLKWPNDLLLNGKKLAGMLAESVFESDRITSLVFGVGLNVNLTQEDIAEDLRDTATSLRVESDQTYCLEEITAIVLEEISAGLKECILGIDEDRVADDWSLYAAFQSESVNVLQSDGKSVTGTLTGIDRSGSLLLRNSEGTLQSFRAGDVSLRPA